MSSRDLLTADDKVLPVKVGASDSLAILSLHWSRIIERAGMDATTEKTGREDLREIRRRHHDHLRVQPHGLLTQHRRLV